MPDGNFTGGIRNPLLPNSHELTGALVSHFNTTSGEVAYTDARVLAPGADGAVNEQSRVRFHQDVMAVCRLMKASACRQRVSAPLLLSSKPRGVRQLSLQTISAALSRMTGTHTRNCAAGGY